MTAAIAVGALGFAWVQLGQARSATAAERAIAAHRDLTVGEVGEARDRLTTLFWQEGEGAFGRNVCWRPLSFAELLPPNGRLSSYHDEVLDGDRSEPMRDLFKILWSFERIDAIRTGGAADEDLLHSLVAFHAVWWDEAVRHITEADVRSRGALVSLAGWAVDRDGRLNDWVVRDFPTDSEVARDEPPDEPRSPRLGSA